MRITSQKRLACFAQTAADYPVVAGVPRVLNRNLSRPPVCADDARVDSRQVHARVGIKLTVGIRRKILLGDPYAKLRDHLRAGDLLPGVARHHQTGDPQNAVFGLPFAGLEIQQLEFDRQTVAGVLDAGVDARGERSRDLLGIG